MDLNKQQLTLIYCVEKYKSNVKQLPFFITFLCLFVHQTIKLFSPLCLLLEPTSGTW